MLIHPEHGGTPREAGLAVEVETGGGVPAAEATPVARRAENGSRMPLLRLLAFATPTIPLAAMAMPVTTYLPNY